MSDTSAMNRKCDVCKTREGKYYTGGYAYCGICLPDTSDMKSEPPITHSPDCWRHHPECAVGRIERVLEYASDDDERIIHRRLIGPNGVAKAIRAIIAGEE